MLFRSGRPWFFADLNAAYAGVERPAAPTVGEVADTIREHARLLAEHQSEHHAVLAIRKHVGWYLTGYPVGGAIRRRIVESASMVELDERLDELPRAVTLPDAERDRPRGTRRGPHPITLPQGWLSAESAAPPSDTDADLAVTGG